MNRRESFKALWGPVALALAVVCGCGGAQTPDAGRLWSKWDLQKSLYVVNSEGGPATVEHVTLNLKPPFYTGSMPVEYGSLSNQTTRRRAGSMKAPVMHQHAGWSNLFIYKDKESFLFCMPDGAVAIDEKTKTLAAECRITKLQDENKHLRGLQISEVHYSDKGTPVFAGTSRVDFRTGFKTGEIISRGKKERDYFFLWPCGMNG